VRIEGHWVSRPAVALDGETATLEVIDLDSWAVAPGPGWPRHEVALGDYRPPAAGWTGLHRVEDGMARDGELGPELMRHLAQYMHLAADFRNHRRRVEQQRDERRRYAAALIVEDLLPVLDDLQRALASAGDPEESSVAAGLEAVVRRFEDALLLHGVSRIRTVGERFDPALHQAELTLESSDVDEERVSAELRPGYRLHDRVLRPARVTVLRPPRPSTP
jgi:molecular chaperone GrpE